MARWHVHLGKNVVQRADYMQAVWAEHDEGHRNPSGAVYDCIAYLRILRSVRLEKIQSSFTMNNRYIRRTCKYLNIRRLRVEKCCV